MLLLFLPVTISIGIVNLDIFINAGFGSLVSSHAPAAINNAFRIYMLPQGIFSVAVATVLFPTLSRLAAHRNVGGIRRAVGNGTRQINLLLIPSAALMAVLATPITRLLYQHGNFGPLSTHLTATALFWFSFSLPFAGVNLLLTRTFFAVQRPWIPTKLAAMNMIVDVIVSLALYKPLGIAGLVIGTASANIVMTGAAAPPAADRAERPARGRPDADDHGPDRARDDPDGGGRRGSCGRRSTSLLGRSLVAQILSVGIACAAAVALYAKTVLWMRIPEAHQIQSLVMQRLRGAGRKPTDELLGATLLQLPPRAGVPERDRVHRRVRDRPGDHPRDPRRRRAVPQHQRGRPPHPPLDVRDPRAARGRLRLDLPDRDRTRRPEGAGRRGSARPLTALPRR